MDDGTIARWLDGLGAMDNDNTRHALAMFALLGLPAAYLDVGSGTGVMANVARKLGVDAWGMDLLPRPDHWLLQRDLTEPQDLARRFPLVTCIEVAEHLPPEAAPVLCGTLARHVAPGGLLVFTAALPGQSGTDHRTLEPPVFWRALLTEAGLTYSYGLTLKLALLWSNIHTPHGHLAANLQIFTNGTAVTPSGVSPC